MDFIQTLSFEQFIGLFIAAVGALIGLAGALFKLVVYIVATFLRTQRANTDRLDKHERRHGQHDIKHAETAVKLEHHSDQIADLQRKD